MLSFFSKYDRRHFALIPKLLLFWYGFFLHFLFPRNLLDSNSSLSRSMALFYVVPHTHSLAYRRWQRRQEKNVKKKFHKRNNIFHCNSSFSKQFKKAPIDRIKNNAKKKKKSRHRIRRTLLNRIINKNITFIRSIVQYLLVGINNFGRFCAETIINTWAASQRGREK